MYYINISICGIHNFCGTRNCSDWQLYIGLNPDRKTLQKVEFLGFGKHLKFSKSCMYRCVYTFVDHVEDLNVAKLLKSSILAPSMTHLSSTSEEKQKNNTTLLAVGTGTPEV